MITTSADFPDWKGQNLYSHKKPKTMSIMKALVKKHLREGKVVKQHFRNIGERMAWIRSHKRINKKKVEEEKEEGCESMKEEKGGKKIDKKKIKSCCSKRK